MYEHFGRSRLTFRTSAFGAVGAALRAFINSSALIRSGARLLAAIDEWPLPIAIPISYVIHTDTHQLCENWGALAPVCVCFSVYALETSQAERDREFAFLEHPGFETNPTLRETLSLSLSLCLFGSLGLYTQRFARDFVCRIIIWFERDLWLIYSSNSGDREKERERERERA